jgi:hypothetical protein
VGLAHSEFFCDSTDGVSRGDRIWPNDQSRLVVGPVASGFTTLTAGVVKRQLMQTNLRRPAVAA